MIRDQRDWDDKARIYMSAYRNLAHSTTKISPAMLVFGHRTTLAPDLEFGSPYPNATEKYIGEYTRDLKEKLLEMHDHARKNLEIAAIKNKRYYDRKAIVPELKIGDLVWLYHPIKTRHLNRKLTPNWICLCEVVEKLIEVVYRIKNASPNKEGKQGRSNWIKTVHADRLRLLRRPDSKASGSARGDTVVNNQTASPPTKPLFIQSGTLTSTRIDPNILTNKFIGMRRKSNARRVFPQLRVQIITSAQLDSTARRQMSKNVDADQHAHGQVNPRTINSTNLERMFRLE